MRIPRRGYCRVLRARCVITLRCIRAAALLGVVAGPLAAGCGKVTGDLGSLHRPSADAGTTTSHDSGAPSSHLDAAPSTAADAAPAATTPMDASWPPSLADAGTPPEYCIPSCIWDGIRDCIPSPASECHSTAGTLGQELCDPVTGWTQIGPVDRSMAGKILTITSGGATCLLVGWGGASPIPGYSYAGRSGQLGYVSYDGKTARCASQGPVLNLEPGRSECAPFRLPASGPLVPRLACKSVVDGPCNLGP